MMNPTAPMMDTPVVPMLPVMTPAQVLDRKAAITAFIRDVLIEGTDYGKLEGYDQPSLYKPGAEKFAAFFGLTHRVRVERSEDWLGSGAEGETFLRYDSEVDFYRGSVHIGTGVGSANSREKKYRYRWCSRQEALESGWNLADLQSRAAVYSEFEFAINSGETTGAYGKPEEYWAAFRREIAAGTATALNKKTRKGAEYPAWQIEMLAYRVPNPEIADLANTILKMSKKRAFIDGVIASIGLSEWVTQDIEDMAADAEAKAAALRPGSNEAATPAATGSPAQSNGAAAKPAEGAGKPATRGKQAATSRPAARSGAKTLADMTPEELSKVATYNKKGEPSNAAARELAGRGGAPVPEEDVREEALGGDEPEQDDEPGVDTGEPDVAVTEAGGIEIPPAAWKKSGLELTDVRAAKRFVRDCSAVELEAFAAIDPTPEIGEFLDAVGFLLDYYEKQGDIT